MLLDLIALLIFFICTVGYHLIYYPYKVKTSPLTTAKGKIDLYRRSWVENILENKDIDIAVDQVRNLARVTSLFASSSLIIVGLLANLLLGGKYSFTGVNQIKVYLLISIFAASFMLFLFSLRYLNYFTILLGAKPEVIEKYEGIDMVTFLTEKINLAMNRYTLGVRCYYYSIGALSWFFNTYAFILITLVVTILVATASDL